MMATNQVLPDSVCGPRALRLTRHWDGTVSLRMDRETLRDVTFALSTAAGFYAQRVVADQVDGGTWHADQMALFEALRRAVEDATTRTGF